MSQQQREEKMKRKILVIKSEVLYNDKQFEGFCSAWDYDFEQIILKNFEYQIRGIMETDASYQQAIPYAIIVNPNTNKIIAYQRGWNDSVAGETRLHGKRSLWVGGHIELEEKDSPNPLHATLIKEIQEEIGVKSLLNVKVIWYINDNTDEVGKVHFGILYVVYTDENNVHIGDGELKQVFFKNIDEIEEIMNSENCDVESWSRIAREAYKNMM